MYDSKDMFLYNMETGEKIEIHPGTTQIEWCDKDTHPIDINHSYKFECTIDSDELNKTLDDTPGFKTACRLTDELNDLIEEYYAPGTPRRERRAIKREFDKIFRIFRKHCQAHHINFKFDRPQN